MTPSNPSNSQPLIYRIMDALGVSHLVACINHTHEQSEVDGLSNALNGKINKVATGQANKLVVANSDGNIMLTGLSISDVQQKLTFDSAPTANSTNPVTSGGVKTALDAKQDTLTFDSTPTASSDNPVTSGGVKAYVDNKQSLSREVLDSEVGIRNAHSGDDEYDQAEIIGADRILIGIGEDAGDWKLYIDNNNAGNLERALANPDTTPTANSNALITSGGVKASLDGKVGLPSDTIYPSKLYALQQNGTLQATPYDIGAISVLANNPYAIMPYSVEYSGTSINLDSISGMILKKIHLKIGSSVSGHLEWNQIFTYNGNKTLKFAADVPHNINAKDEVFLTAYYDNSLSCYWIVSEGYFPDNDTPVE